MTKRSDDQFEQVDGLSLLDHMGNDGAGRWIEWTEGALWGGAGLVCYLVITGLIIAAVMG